MAVRHVEGVNDVEGDAKARTVSVSFDSEKTSLEDIKGATSWIGYAPDVE